MAPDDYQNFDRQARVELEAQLPPEEKVKLMAAFIIRVGAPAQEIIMPTSSSMSCRDRSLVDRANERAPRE